MPWIQKLMAVEVDITNNVVAWQRPTAQQTHLHCFTKKPYPPPSVHGKFGKSSNQVGAGLVRDMLVLRVKLQVFTGDPVPNWKLQFAVGFFHTVARRDGGHWDDSKEFWVEVKWGLTTWERNLTNTLTWLTPILLMDSFLPNWRLCALW